MWGNKASPHQKVTVVTGESLCSLLERQRKGHPYLPSQFKVKAKEGIPQKKKKQNRKINKLAVLI